MTTANMTKSAKSAKPATTITNLPDTLEGLAAEINTVFVAEDVLVKERESKISAAIKAIEDEAKPAIDDKRLEAGRLLLEAKARVPNGGFARWIEVNFGPGRPQGRTYRSRSDCYQCMRMAGADDPDKEREKEKADTRARVQKHREGKKAAAAKSVTPDAVTDNVVSLLERPTTPPEEQLPYSFCSAPPNGSSAEDIAYAMIGDRRFTQMKTLDEYLNATDRVLDAIDAGQSKATAHAEGSYYRAPGPVRQQVRELLADRDWARGAEATLAANVTRVTEKRDQAHAAAKATLYEAKAAAEPEIDAVKALAEELSPAAKLTFAEWVSEWDTDALTDVVLGRPPEPRDVDVPAILALKRLEAWTEYFTTNVASSIDDLDPVIREMLDRAFSAAYSVMTLGPAPASAVLEKLDRAEEGQAVAPRLGGL